MFLNCHCVPSFPCMSAAGIKGKWSCEVNGRASGKGLGLDVCAAVLQATHLLMKLTISKE